MVASWSFIYEYVLCTTGDGCVGTTGIGIGKGDGCVGTTGIGIGKGDGLVVGVSCTAVYRIRIIKIRYV